MLKLPQLPDRTPVKITISISPDLHQALGDYAVLYEQAYGRQETVADLIPAIVASFLESDRGFQKARTLRGPGEPK